MATKSVGLYSPELKEYVYQVWTFYCGRNASRTARWLLENQESRERLLAERADLPREDSLVRQINLWSASYGWNERAIQEIKDIAPDIWGITVADVIAGASEAAGYCRTVLSWDDGAEGVTPNMRLRMARVKLEAAKLLLTAAGFGGGRSNPVTDSQQTASLASRTNDMLSEDEKRAIIHSLSASLEDTGDITDRM